MNKCLVLLLAIVSFSCLKCNDDIQEKRNKAEEETISNFKEVVTSIFKKVCNTQKFSERVSPAEKIIMERKLKRAREEALSICYNKSLYSSFQEQVSCLRKQGSRCTRSEKDIAYPIVKFKLFDHYGDEV